MLGLAFGSKPEQPRGAWIEGEAGLQAVAMTEVMRCDVGGRKKDGAVSEVEVTGLSERI